MASTCMALVSGTDLFAVQDMQVPGADEPLDGVETHPRGADEHGGEFHPHHADWASRSRVRRANRCGQAAGSLDLACDKSARDLA